ncbi:MAG: hypothetical protein JO222_13115 [Frankiales bacterium]|nr:hypothetical protein [Frankiales bacterium]
MGELMGTLRPVKQLINTSGPTHHYDVEPVGEATTSVRYQEVEDLGVIEILDDVRLPFAEGADGFALYDQGGTLQAWWQLFAGRPGEDLRINGGFAFKATPAGTDTRLTETAEAGAR